MDAASCADIGSQSIAEFLDRLAARAAVPGGGATAALGAAQGAALLAMVARYSSGPKYQQHAETITAVTEQADQLRAECLQLATADGEAFGVVAAAYGLPRDTDEQKAARSAAIASALAAAAAPQAAVIAAAAHLLDLIETLLPIGNRSIVSDLAAGAAAVHAAVITARINVEVNLSGVTDSAVREEYADALAGADGLLARAAEVSAAVRGDIAK
jgi:methenyltetrahydrofolate cyclohydrolase